MELIIVLVAIVVLGLGAMVAAGAFGGMQSEPVRDNETMVLPSAPVTGDELRAVRFDVTPRGYSMAEVDALLGRLADEADGKPQPAAAPAATATAPKTSSTVEDLDEAEAAQRANVKEGSPKVLADRWRGKDTAGEKQSAPTEGGKSDSGRPVDSGSGKNSGKVGGGTTADVPPDESAWADHSATPDD